MLLDPSNAQLPAHPAQSFSCLFNVAALAVNAVQMAEPSIICIDFHMQTSTTKWIQSPISEASHGFHDMQGHITRVKKLVLSESLSRTVLCGESILFGTAAWQGMGRVNSSPILKGAFFKAR
jgi:hypothetical protein